MLNFHFPIKNKTIPSYILMLLLTFLIPSVKSESTFFKLRDSAPLLFHE